jgi:nucleotide-binding universal stress UspA family protein
LWQMGPEGGLHAHAERVLTDAEKAARAAAPGVDVYTAVVTELPLPLLVAESRTATLVVVGHSGLGVIADALSGSPSVQLLSQSKAPVAVVRGGRRADSAERLVVAGVDGSPHGAAAVAVAIEEAAVRSGRLLAVHVQPNGLAARLTQLRLKLSQRHLPLVRRRPAMVRPIDEALQGLRGTYPEVPIEECALPGHPAGVLVDLSSRADLIVVGARGRGGFAGMLLGSVSQTLIHQTRCPVIVVPPDAVPASPTGPLSAEEVGAR